MCAPALGRASNTQHMQYGWHRGEKERQRKKRKRNTVCHRRISNHFDSVAWQCTHWMSTKHTLVVLIEWPTKGLAPPYQKHTWACPIWAHMNIPNRQYDVIPQIKWQSPILPGDIEFFKILRMDLLESTAAECLLVGEEIVDIACRPSNIFTSLKRNGDECRMEPDNNRLKLLFKFVAAIRCYLE